MNTWIMVDVETDGPCPGLYSMIELGAVVVEPGLHRTFHAKMAPITDKYEEEALRVTGYSRYQTQMFPDAEGGIIAFKDWLDTVRDGRNVCFVSDNNGFDWQFVNYYFHRFNGRNPFGFSSTNLGSLYKGLIKDMRKNFKHLRITPHTHNPVDDARGNAEAMLQMISHYELPGVLPVRIDQPEKP